MFEGLAVLNMIEKTKLKVIDPERLKITKLSSEDAFLVELPLDGAPQEDWLELFEKELKKTPQPLAIMNKPNDDSFPMFETNYPTSSQGDTISIITTPIKLHGDIKLVMQLVEKVNDRVDQHNKEVNEQSEKENQVTKNYKETISEMRDSLKKNPPTL
jgi:hypothetical protein